MTISRHVRSNKRGTYTAIVALDQQTSSIGLLDHPPADKGKFGVFEPDVSLAGKVVLALDGAYLIVCPWPVLILDELRSECVGRGRGVAL